MFNTDIHPAQQPETFPYPVDVAAQTKIMKKAVRWPLCGWYRELAAFSLQFASDAVQHVSGRPHSEGDRTAEQKKRCAVSVAHWRSGSVRGKRDFGS